MLCTSSAWLQKAAESLGGGSPSVPAAGAEGQQHRGPVGLHTPPCSGTPHSARGTAGPVRAAAAGVTAGPAPAGTRSRERRRRQRQLIAARRRRWTFCWGTPSAPPWGSASVRAAPAPPDPPRASARPSGPTPPGASAGPFLGETPAPASPAGPAAR